MLSALCMASAREALKKVAADILPLRPRVSMIVHDGKGGVLVGRSRSGGYVLPGGGVDPGESVTEAGRRETLEEAGWQVKDLHDTGHRSEVAWSQAYLDSLPAGSERRQFGGSLTHFIVGRADRPDSRLLGSEGDALSAPRFVPLPHVLREAEKAHRLSQTQKGPDAEIHRQYSGKLVTALRYAQQHLAAGAKTASPIDMLPDFLAKPHRDGYIDPRTDDFSKNQAFGRAMGAGGLAALAGAAVTPVAPHVGIPVALLGTGLGMGVYRHSLSEFRDRQARGLNPVTNKPHDPASIARMISWSQKRHQARYPEEAREAEKSAGEGVEYMGKHFPGYNQPVASDKKDKKMMVLVRKGDEVRLIHFGQKGYAHNYSAEAKANYLARSAGIRDKDGGLTKDDPFSPNYWARGVLWPKGPATGEKG